MDVHDVDCICLRDRLVSPDEQQVLVVRVGRAIAQVMAAGEYDAVGRQRIDVHDLVVDIACARSRLLSSSFCQNANWSSTAAAAATSITSTTGACATQDDGFAAWSSRRAHRGCGPGPRLAGAYPAFDQNSFPAELVRSSAVRRAGHVVQRCAGGRERLVLDARAEVAEDPVEVRDGPGVQMRQRDRLALVRIDDEVDEAR